MTTTNLSQPPLTLLPPFNRYGISSEKELDDQEKSKTEVSLEQTSKVMSTLETIAFQETIVSSFLYPCPLRPRRVVIDNINFDNVTMAEAITHICWMAHQTDRSRHICTGNLDHLLTLRKDQRFQEAYRQADLVLADGMPIVWLSRLNAHRTVKTDVIALKERVTGSDLFWELGKASADTGLRLFLLGGMQGAAEKAADALRARFPGASICGTYYPPCKSFETPAEEARITEAITTARPDILLVGLGAPKQENWILANKERLHVPVSIGVGGSFELAAGMYRRAPLWMQKIGVEWLYRMLQDPSRLCRRYLMRDLPFFVMLVMASLISTVTPDTGRAIMEEKFSK